MGKALIIPWNIVSRCGSAGQYCPWCDKDDHPDPRITELVAIRIRAPKLRGYNLTECLITEDGVRFRKGDYKGEAPEVVIVTRCKRHGEIHFSLFGDHGGSAHYGEPQVPKWLEESTEPPQSKPNAA